MREIVTLPDIYAISAENYPERTALSRKIDGVWAPVTYLELERDILAFAVGLHTLGVGKGDRVGLMLGNGPEWVLGDMGTLTVGGADVPLYGSLSDEQAKYILKDSGAKAVLVGGDDQFEKLTRIAPDLPDLKYAITVEEGRELIPGRETITLASLMKTGASADEKTVQAVKDVRASLSEDDLASIIYTSGTTGMPKGVMLTHGNFAHNVKGVRQVVDILPTDKHLSFLPLSHVFERTAGYYSMLRAGGAIHYVESMDTIADNIKEVHPTVVISVPRLFEKMIGKIKMKVDAAPEIRQKLFYWAMDVGARATDPDNPGRNGLLLKLQHALANKLVFGKLHEAFGGRIRFFVSGGAALSREVSLFFRAIGIKVLEGYGLTETSPVICVNPPDDIRPGSVGRPLPNVTIKRADDGELCVKGPSVTQGYYNLPDKNKEAFDDEGWFHTGDIVEISDDGFVSITDRKKDIIVMSNGKNVAPQTLEQKLVADDYIAQAVVVGNNRNYITALIVPDFERLKIWAADNGLASTENKDLICDEKVEAFYNDRVRAVMEQFSRYEQVRKFTLLPRELTEADGELTPTLKVKRKQVDQKYAGIVENMYSREEDHDKLCTHYNP